MTLVNALDAPDMTAGQPAPRPRGDGATYEALAARLTDRQGPLARRVDADPEQVEQGLAKLVLTLIELLRRLLEKQAIRRIEGGSLSDEQIERMGETFLKLDQKMTELKATFGLEHEELNLHLGPLGDLM